jgi:glyoxylase-like metal-dependent hydrolase (beta-lactamase superfamily II)
VPAETITVTGTLQRQAWSDRVLPPVERLRPDLWSVPTPFPQSPLRYVLAYLLETAKGPVLVDTGWPSEEAWDGLVAGIRQTGHEIGDVTAVLVTHHHADHYGLANRVRQASGAWVGLHALDAAASRAFGSMREYVELETAWLLRRGVPKGGLTEMLPSGDGKAEWGPGPDVLLEDGQRLDAAGGLRAIWTPGHTPGHTCFAHEGHDLLLSGDHILPRISPNISPAPDVTDDILGDYLGSLGVLADLDVAEVLPAHEYRFAGLATRVGQLQRHHADRLAEVLAVVGAAAGCTTLDVASRLTWSRPWTANRGMVRRYAIGETYAHLVHLVRLGRLRNVSDSLDRWQLVG